MGIAASGYGGQFDGCGKFSISLKMLMMILAIFSKITTTNIFSKKGRDALCFFFTIDGHLVRLLLCSGRVWPWSSSSSSWIKSTILYQLFWPSSSLSIPLWSWSKMSIPDPKNLLNLLSTFFSFRNHSEHQQYDLCNVSSWLSRYIVIINITTIILIFIFKRIPLPSCCCGQPRTFHKVNVII